MLKQSDEVKPGDELALRHGYNYYTFRIVKVQSVTPSGRIVLEGGSYFDNKGFPFGSSKFDSNELFLLTPEIRAKIKRDARLSYLKNFVWDRVGDELLDELVQMLHRNGFDSVE